MTTLITENRKIDTGSKAMKIFNHISPPFSELEWRMVKHIPPGGNWQNIPEAVPSKRLEQIRNSGGRTTYYGRLQNNNPSYTISTYFNRMGNGCYIHPEQDRLISIREAARLQSFRDSFIFHGTKSSQYKQVGNAVPPLLARAVAESIEPYLVNKTIIDLFAGAGGMSEGFLMQGFKLLGAIEIEKNYFETYLKNHDVSENNKFLILGDITEEKNKKILVSIKRNCKVGVIVGGPPCQGFSHAGWRNPNDKRNKLFLDFVELVKEIRPEIFILENVPGILSMRKGEAIKEIINCFTDIGYYVNKPFLLKAEHFGVPQLRRRVFLIGSMKAQNILPPKPLFRYERAREKLQPDRNINGNLPLAVNVQDAIGGLPPLRAGEGEMEIISELGKLSDYEEFLLGKTSFKSFYKVRMKNLP